MAKQSQKERETQFKQTANSDNKNATTANVAASATPSNSIPSSTNAIKMPKASVPAKIVKKTELELKIIDAKDKHPAQKKDIYKAIFDSSDDESDADAEPTENVADINQDAANKDMRQTQPAPNYQPLPDIAFMPQSAKELNILRNTSPPRGIFSGLLTASRKTEQVKPVQDTEDNIRIELPENSYGPSLPPKFQGPSTGSTVPIAGSYGSIKVHLDEHWIEKGNSSPETKPKKEKKVKKKSKKERKKDKHKNSHHRDKKKKSKR